MLLTFPFKTKATHLIFEWWYIIVCYKAVKSDSKPELRILCEKGNASLSVPLLQSFKGFSVVKMLPAVRV
jgi:hypothetical protein